MTCSTELQPFQTQEFAHKTLKKLGYDAEPEVDMPSWSRNRLRARAKATLALEADDPFDGLLD